MTRNFLAIILLLFAVSAYLVPMAAIADADEDDHLRLEHNQVFKAVRDGRIQPLSTVLMIVARDYGTPVIDVEFEIENGVWIYEIVALNPNGHVMEFYFDAATARLLKIKDAGNVETFE